MHEPPQFPFFAIEWYQWILAMGVLVVLVCLMVWNWKMCFVPPDGYGVIPGAFFIIVVGFFLIKFILTPNEENILYKQFLKELDEYNQYQNVVSRVRNELTQKTQEEFYRRVDEIFNSKKK